MKAIEVVALSRNKNRPTAIEYIRRLTEGFIQLHGDRYFADDKAVVGGIATMFKKPVTVIGIEKGTDTNLKIQHNFGCASPEGYRKALRLMRQAEKFKRPILCLVDTSGASCGIGAEERGQAEAIASNIKEMFDIKVPILSILIGEGGSGGALGLAVADEVWMNATSTYSVISPEGCASILWKDASKVAEAAEALKMTAESLDGLKVVERILAEEDFSDEFFYKLKAEVSEFFSKKLLLKPSELLELRYNRFRNF